MALQHGRPKREPFVLSCIQQQRTTLVDPVKISLTVPDLADEHLVGVGSNAAEHHLVAGLLHLNDEAAKQ